MVLIKVEGINYYIYAKIYDMFIVYLRNNSDLLQLIQLSNMIKIQMDFNVIDSVINAVSLHKRKQFQV
jgi:hypothetical protein